MEAALFRECRQLVPVKPRPGESAGDTQAQSLYLDGPLIRQSIWVQLSLTQSSLRP